jgi:hypothetical protein
MMCVSCKREAKYTQYNKHVCERCMVIEADTHCLKCRKRRRPESTLFLQSCICNDDYYSSDSPGVDNVDDDDDDDEAETGVSCQYDAE